MAVETVAPQPPRWATTLRCGSLLVLALILVGTRLGMELVRPTGIDDNKLTIYAKDVILLFPAGILILLALRNERLYQISRAWADLLSTGVAGWVKALAAGFICASVAGLVYKTNAQIIDEAVYLFQARLFSEGRLSMPVPAGLPAGSLGDYVANRDGRAFGIFFPGQSIALMLGLLFHLAWVVNPILTALLSFLTYRIGRQLYGTRVAGTATAIFLLSPFVIFQGASYFSHVLASCLFCGSLFLFVFNTTGNPVRDAISGLLSGALLLQRPLSAAVVLLCLLLYALWTLEFRVALRRGVVLTSVFSLGFAALLFYNYALTGNALVTPHDYFFHHSEFRLGLNLPVNSLINLGGLAVDLVGIPVIGLAPLGYLALHFPRLALETRFLLIVCAIYVVAYGLYEYHGLSYGPRFWFELVPIFCLLTAEALGQWDVSFFGKSAAGNPISGATFITTTTLIVALGILPTRFLIWSARSAVYALPTDLDSQVEKPAVVFLKGEPWRHLNPQIAALQHDGALENTAILFLSDTGIPTTDVHSMFPGRSIYCFDLLKKTVASYPCAG